MTYTETLDFIQSLDDKQLLPDHQNSVTLMAYLGNPQDNMPVVHVAGTNGKGSTIAFMTSVLMAGGYKVGTFTSPHILSPLELVSINRESVDELSFAKAMTTVAQAASKMTSDGHNHPTAFECMTAASMLILSQAALDVAIIEVGLGGRFDATNVFKKPLLTVITRIDYDHTALLGETLSEIAWHKGGIIRPQVPTVIAPNPFEVIEAISGIVRETGDKLYLMDEGFIVEKVLMTTGHTKLFHLKSNFFDYKGLRTSLLGRHQVHNLATALLAVYQLRKKLPVTEAQIKDGVAAATWSCRGEVVSKTPLILIDGGHNVNGTEALQEMLATHFKGRQIITVLGLLGDKDLKGICNIVTTFSHKVILTKPLSPRAAEPASLPIPSIHKEADYKKAIEKALSLADDKTLILIMGSLYLANPAKTYLKEILQV